MGEPDCDLCAMMGYRSCELCASGIVLYPHPLLGDVCGFCLDGEEHPEGDDNDHQPA